MNFIVETKTIYVSLHNLIAAQPNNIKMNVALSFGTF